MHALLFDYETLVVQATVFYVDTSCPTAVWYEGADGDWEFGVSIVVDDEALFACPVMELKPFTEIEVSVRRKKLRVFGRKWKVDTAYIGDERPYLQSYTPW